MKHYLIFQDDSDWDDSPPTVVSENELKHDVDNGGERFWGMLCIELNETNFPNMLSHPAIQECNDIK